MENKQTATKPTTTPAAEAPATTAAVVAAVARQWHEGIANRFDRMFGSAVFNRVDQEMSVAERTGNKRKKLADVLIPALDPATGEPNGAEFRAIIALKQKKNESAAYYDLTIPGSGFNQAISTDNDPAAAAEYKAWGESVIDAFVIWTKAQGNDVTATTAPVRRKLAGISL